MKQSRTKALKQIKEGDIVEARCHAFQDWGIFLTYKSLTMLLHVSDCSHGRVKKPSDLASVGDTMRVKITKIDPKTPQKHFQGTQGRPRRPQSPKNTSLTAISRKN